MVNNKNKSFPEINEDLLEASLSCHHPDVALKANTFKWED